MLIIQCSVLSARCSVWATFGGVRSARCGNTVRGAECAVLGARRSEAMETECSVRGVETRSAVFILPTF